jgi:enoyl-CoA hydratase/carnithine racemase
MDFETILVDVADGVATVTLNRPEKMNAWNATMGRELPAAMRALDGDDAVRAVVLTGAGRAFCAGADLTSGGGASFSRYAGRHEDAAREDGPAFHPFQVRKPVIAAINGHAVGVGITYPLLADVRYVAADAKIAFAFVRRGVLPELASHYLLPRIVGLSNASDLLLSGRTISGAEAVELGLATKALPAAEVLPAALAWARDVAANVAPVSAAVAKKLIWEGLSGTVDDTLRREQPLFGWATAQVDATEGVQAFLDKRHPDWKLRVSTDTPA